MNQPPFTLWPWKILALAVPAMAIAAVILARQNARSEEEMLTIFFGIVAAGNAYLFAMAVGDFGRSVTAIPAGAVAGLAAVQLFAYALPNMMFLLILGLIVMASIAGQTTRATEGCGMAVMLIIGFTVAFPSLGSITRKEPSLALLSAYPFVCGCVAATMPVENTIGEVFSAGIAGARAAMHGLLYGGLVFVALVFFGFLMIPPPRIPPLVLLAFGVFAAICANYFCVRHIFLTVQRTEAPKTEPDGSHEPGA